MRGEQLGSRWAVYGCNCGIVRRDVELGEKEVSKYVHLLLMTGGDDQ